MKIHMVTVRSSQIHAIGHDASTGTMAVQFKGRGGSPGSIYHYDGVSPEQFAAFHKADSIGSHFGTHFKSNEAHPFKKV